MITKKPDKDRGVFLFLNLGHALTHLFMLLFPTVILSLEAEFNRTYSELVALATPGFIAFGAGSILSGWLGDRWSRQAMMTVFFVGIGLASIFTGMTNGPLGIAVGLTLIGLFASIYHPIGIALVVRNDRNVGKLLGLNGVCGNLGVATAGLTAGALTDLINWRAAFWVPSIVTIIAGICFYIYTRDVDLKPVVKKSSPQPSGIRKLQFRIYGVIAVTTLFAGLTFNGALVALPKVFAQRMTDFTSSTIGIGGLVSIIYAVGASAQILVGYLLDRYPLKSIMIGVALIQLPLLLGASTFNNWALLIVSAFMMLTIFGQIPINDTLVARNSSDAVRARIYALKYVLGLGVSSLAVPLISFVHGATGEFVWLFRIFAVCSALIILTASFLPPAPSPRKGD